jgi:hypothetical protein
MEEEMGIQIEEGQKRYQRIKNVIEELNGRRFQRPMEWYDIHFDYLSEYSAYFDDFTIIHPEIKDKEFRNKAIITQKIIDRLLKDYSIYRWFGLYDYQRLNENLLWMAEYVFNEQDDTELCDILDQLKI